MNLHEDKNNFRRMILAAEKHLKINRAMIEKDYYVTLLLHEIAESIPNIIFKGGTSLSKCHKILDRFSEDIDFSLDTDMDDVSSDMKSELHFAIRDIVDKLGLTIEYFDENKKEQFYNKYIVNYNPEFSSDALKQHLIVETFTLIKSFPCKSMEATSLIHDFLKSNGDEQNIEQFGLKPFNIAVQSLERTLIDKLFAISDYYVENKTDRNSRHIYDIYKILPHVNINDEFTRLAEDVRNARKFNKEVCVSAQDDTDVQWLLQKVVKERFCEQDFYDVTEAMQYDNISYSEAITGIQDILKSGCLSKDIDNGKIENIIKKSKISLVEGNDGLFFYLREANPDISGVACIKYIEESLEIYISGEEDINVKVRLNNKSNNVKADCSVKINGFFTIDNVKVVSDDSGNLSVDIPHKKSDDNKFVRLLASFSEKMKDMLNNNIIKAYKRAIEGDEWGSSGAGSMGSGESQNASRGSNGESRPANPLVKPIVKDGKIDKAEYCKEQYRVLREEYWKDELNNSREHREYYKGIKDTMQVYLDKHKCPVLFTNEHKQIHIEGLSDENINKLANGEYVSEKGAKWNPIVSLTPHKQSLVDNDEAKTQENVNAKSIQPEPIENAEHLAASNRKKK
jgi:predicted nucleotidyltransferase component of viral defense system/DNA-binding cell septation regulator SpoVG